MNNLRIGILGILGAAPLLSSAPAFAQDSATLSVGAQIADSCTVSAQDLDFDVLDTQTVTQSDASATVTIQCTVFSVFEVSMGPGFHNSAGQRRMSSGSDFIDYQVYQNNLRTLPWTTGVGGTRWGVVALPGGSQDLEAYGRVTGLSPATAGGSYSDQLEVIVYF